MTAKRDILIIGISRIHGLTWRRKPGYNIKLQSYNGLTHTDLIHRANSAINDYTSILILVALQVELHSRTMDRQGRPGLVFANPTPPIHEIVTTLSTYDLKWKSKGITVLWVGPYTPNMVLLNTVRKQKRGWGIMMPYEVEMAEYFQIIIEGNRTKLIDEMKRNHLVVTELQLRPWDLTSSAGSDGLHLGSASKHQLFDSVINQAIEMHQAGPPQIKEVGLPLNAEMREAWNEVKRHKRRMRRTRAAEREVYRAAAAEKQENND